MDSDDNELRSLTHVNINFTFLEGEMTIEGFLGVLEGFVEMFLDEEDKKDHPIEALARAECVARVSGSNIAIEVTVAEATLEQAEAAEKILDNASNASAKKDSEQAQAFMERLKAMLEGSER